MIFWGESRRDDMAQAAAGPPPDPAVAAAAPAPAGGAGAAAAAAAAGGGAAGGAGAAPAAVAAAANQRIVQVGAAVAAAAPPQSRWQRICSRVSAAANYVGDLFAPIPVGPHRNLTAQPFDVLYDLFKSKFTAYKYSDVVLNADRLLVKNPRLVSIIAPLVSKAKETSLLKYKLAMSVLDAIKRYQVIHTGITELGLSPPIAVYTTLTSFAHDIYYNVASYIAISKSNDLIKNNLNTAVVIHGGVDAIKSNTGPATSRMARAGSGAVHTSPTSGLEEKLPDILQVPSIRTILNVIGIEEREVAALYNLEPNEGDPAGPMKMIGPLGALSTAIDNKTFNAQLELVSDNLNTNRVFIAKPIIITDLVTEVNKVATAHSAAYTPETAAAEIQRDYSTPLDKITGSVRETFNRIGSAIQNSNIYKRLIQSGLSPFPPDSEVGAGAGGASAGAGAPSTSTREEEEAAVAAILGSLSSAASCSSPSSGTGGGGGARAAQPYSEYSAGAAAAAASSSSAGLGAGAASHLEELDEPGVWGAGARGPPPGAASGGGGGGGRAAEPYPGYGAGAALSAAPSSSSGSAGAGVGAYRAARAAGGAGAAPAGMNLNHIFDDTRPPPSIRDKISQEDFDKIKDLASRVKRGVATSEEEREFDNAKKHIARLIEEAKRAKEERISAHNRGWQKGSGRRTRRRRHHHKTRRQHRSHKAKTHHRSRASRRRHH